MRLTPAPAALLASIGTGARLHERAWWWTEWRLQMPGLDPERIGERAINSLRRHAFIARDGVLPPGRLPHWFKFDWVMRPPERLGWLLARHAHRIGKPRIQTIQFRVCNVAVGGFGCTRDVVTCDAAIIAG